MNNGDVSVLLYCWGVYNNNMDINWEEEKLRIEKEALERHAKLSALFKENRFLFELERKRMINDFINSVEDEKRKKDLMKIQADWDRKMKGAGSSHNRLVLAQTFFWEHVLNVWQPSIKKLSSLLKS